MVPFSLATDVI